MKINRLKKKSAIFFIFFLSFSFVLSCQSANNDLINSESIELISASNSKKKKNSKVDRKSKKNKDTKSESNVEVTSKYEPSGDTSTVEENTKIDISNATVVSVKKGSDEYFSLIDSDVLKGIKIGSPQSIKNALVKFKKAEIEYTDKDLELINIANSIMNLVWKNDEGLGILPKRIPKSNYLGIINSVRSGVFENRFPTKDFFLLALPSIVILSDSVKSSIYPQIEQSLLEALKIESDSVLCNYLLGVLYEKQEMFEKAIYYYDLATEKKSVVYEIYLSKAKCLLKLKKYEQVSNILDNLIIQYPSDINILKLYANVALLLKDYQKAEQYVSLVLQQNPSDLEFVLFRAKIFVEIGEYLKASSLVDVYAKTYPTNRECLLLRSKIQKEWNKNISLAIMSIEKALELYPEDYDVVLYAAQLSAESNQKVAGKSVGELANIILNRYPNDIEVLGVYAHALYNEGKFKESYAVSKNLVSLPASSRDAIFIHIKNCIALKYNDEAWNYASSLYSKDSSNSEIIQAYIDVLIRTGRNQNASRLINSLLSNSPSSLMKSFLYYERSYLQGTEAGQLSDLRSSLIANPRNSDALFRMYQIYLRRRDYRKAQYYLKQVISLNPSNENYIKLNSELESLLK